MEVDPKSEPEKTMKALNFTLPWPPSLNHSYPTKSSGGRRKSKALVAYRENCGKFVLTMGIPRFTFHQGERLGVFIGCHAPTLQSYDLDNRAKAVLDVLQYCGVIANDSQVEMLSMLRGKPDRDGHGYVQIRVEES